MPAGHWVAGVPPSVVGTLPSLLEPPPSPPSLPGTPPSGIEDGKHSGGGIGRPMHTSHGPQSLKQLGTGVHDWHALVSVTFASVHVPTPSALREPSHTYSPPIAAGRPRSAGNVQQPKQSQPFGVIGRHEFKHCAGCDAGQVIPPTDEGVYGQLDPSGGKFGATDSGSQR